MSLVIEAIGGTAVAERRVEVVERKGIGHPDTICDSVAEAAAVAPGTPMRLKPSARTRRVTVLPVPVAPAIRP